MREGAAPRAALPLRGAWKISDLPARPCRSRSGLLLERRGHLVRIGVGRRLDDEHDAAVELRTRLVAVRATLHLAGLAVANRVDQRSIEALARDVGLHGLGAAVRERDVVAVAAGGI